MSYAFFCFLLDCDEDDESPAFTSAEQLREGIDRFRQTAMLLLGNVKYAFKVLSRDTAYLYSVMEESDPDDVEEFALRHLPVLPVAPIAPDDAYLTGYLIERELAQQLVSDPGDREAAALEVRRKGIVARARVNHAAYLASDHLDVYVATSMRQRAEFRAIASITHDIFERLADLNLRYFDPTQAYCINRIDKGLAEALMLRRAACTIYLAQESDTLGKDSELASTLAQGKPVVAFIPQATAEFVDAHLRNIAETDAAMSDSQRMLSQLRVFDPGAAWSDSQVRGWCEDPERADLDELHGMLCQKMRAHYDKRAETLRNDHPLGIQVNLATGVATGVLVVRSIDDCADVVRRILTRQLEFDIVEDESHIALREKISGCVFRVVTKDQMLTNSFWNHYIDPAE